MADRRIWALVGARSMWGSASRTLRTFLVLICVPALIGLGCDDDGGGGRTQDGSTDGGRAETGPTDTGPTDVGPRVDAGPDRGPPDDLGPETPAPHFQLTQPSHGEVLAGLAVVRVDAIGPAVARLVVDLDGAPVAEQGVNGGSLRLLLDPANLADGPGTLQVQAFNAAGALLAAEARPVRVQAAPPAAATVGPEGGALRTPAGVVVVVPAGAVATPTGLRVVDRPLDTLPDVAPPGVTLRQAIDLLPMEGPADPTFRFALPARVLFPMPDDPRAQVIGAGPMVGNIAAGAGGPVLGAVGGATVEGGFAATGAGRGVLVTEVRNLTQPGAPLRPLDLVALHGRRLPTRPDDLKIRIAGGRERNLMVDGSGTRAMLVLPLDTPTGSVDLELVSRIDGRRVVVPIEVVAHYAAPFSIEEAVARVEGLFAGLDAALEGFETGAFADPAEPRVAQVGAWRDRLGATAGVDVAAWRAALSEAKAELLARPLAELLIYGMVLETLDVNLAALGLTAGAQLTQDEACLSLLLMSMFLTYIDFVTGLIPDFTPPGLVKTALMGLAQLIVSTTAKAVGCDDPDEDEDEEGIWGYECDLLLIAEENMMTGSLTGDVWGHGPRSPAGLGYLVGGQLPDDIFVDTLYRLPGVTVRVVDAETGESANLLADVSNPDGGFTLPFVNSDGGLEVQVTLPDGTTFTFNIPAPGPGERVYLPVVLPHPGEGAGPGPDDFEFAITGGAAVGLEDGRGRRGVVAADFDDDGRVDLWFYDEGDRAPGEYTQRSFARNLGGGQFATQPSGPFVNGTPVVGIGASPPLDLDQDGRLDVVGSGVSAVVPALRQTAPGVFEAGGHLDLEGSPCTQPSGLATGDFVAGDGPDVVVWSVPTDAAAPVPVDGFRCVFANGGDGTFSLHSAVALSQVPGLAGGVVGAVADLDGDGHLDAYLDLLGIIAFGDGAGGFEEVRVPETCWQPNQGIGGLWPNPPALIDIDRDGDLDLITPPTQRLDLERAQLVAQSACVLRNDGGRQFTGVPTPLFDGPAFADCRGGHCASFAAADLDGDGHTDLVTWQRGAGLRVLYHRADGWLEGGLLPGALTGFAVADFNGDGRPDLALAADADDRVALQRAGPQGGRVVVDVRSTSGAPLVGATVTVDLDGDGDFDTGPVLASATAGAPLNLGIGAAASVVVRVAFPDTGPAGGHQAVYRAAPGETVRAQDPQ